MILGSSAEVASSSSDLPIRNDRAKEWVKREGGRREEEGGRRDGVDRKEVAVGVREQKAHAAGRRVTKIRVWAKLRPKPFCPPHSTRDCATTRTIENRCFDITRTICT